MLDDISFMKIRTSAAGEGDTLPIGGPTPENELPQSPPSVFHSNWLGGAVVPTHQDE